MSSFTLRKHESLCRHTLRTLQTPFEELTALPTPSSDGFKGPLHSSKGTRSKKKWETRGQKEGKEEKGVELSSKENIALVVKVV